MQQELIVEGSSTEMIRYRELQDGRGRTNQRRIKSRDEGITLIDTLSACYDNMIKVDDGVKEQIMQALSARDQGENIIGLYGPDIKVHDSVKTAIRRAKRDQLFQHIVIANVTKKPHLRKIQSQIGAAIGLSFDDEADAACCVFFAKNKRMSTAERASLLCAKMKELQTVLLVLCNLHGSLDLDKVGLPSAADHKGCKILLTSSSQDVLSNQMKAHVLIEVW